MTVKTYVVKELFHSLQGEGHHAGRPAVFCRFSGCNLWTGVDVDRDKAICKFCDTDFVGTDGTHGGRYDAVSLARVIAGLWDSPARPRFVVLTGGEPMLQVDSWFLDVLHRWECEVAIETNGTKAVPVSLDWITVSPKAGAPLVQRSASELKLVYPQPGAEPGRFDDFDARFRFLQPMDGPDREANTRAAVAYCLAHPEWRLSLQTHKILGLR
jgi:7-carboxy-7-deazaguanine synthase